jgi:hypothetical protein
MNASGQPGRKPRADVQRNRAALLETAQRHFLQYGVGTSLEAVAKEAGVGPGTLYRRTSTSSATPPRRWSSGCGRWRTTSAPSAGCRNR